MKALKLKSTIQNILIMLALGLSATAYTPKLGLDSYEIYLNDKLIMKQFVNHPLNLRTLRLENASPQDELWVKYTHCTNKGAGSDRSIVLSDDKGHQLTEWKFANSGAGNKPMKVSVGELLRMEKEHKDHQISLYYKSNELPKGELLAHLR